MGFWRLFEVASMPILQVLIVSAVGAFMATDYLNLLSSDIRKSLNQIVFVVFTPSLIFASLVKTVTFEDIISWWFMPVNIGITFLSGGILGWAAIKLIKPKPHLEGLIMAMCSTGNFANLLLIMVPAMCTEDGSPFGDHSACKAKGLSYASFSMALGSFYTWTYTFQLMQSSSLRSKMKEPEPSSDEPNEDLDAIEKTRLLSAESQGHIDVVVPLSDSTWEDTENQPTMHEGSTSKEEEKKDASFSSKVSEILHKILEQLFAPPTLGSIAGLIIGPIPFLKNLVIGDTAPLRVIQDSVSLLGDGMIPCLTLILGGNLIQGLKKASIKPVVIFSIICVRYLILPMVGIGMIKAAAILGLLPSDPLFSFVLMIMFALPPGVNISTMAQLFDVGQEECSVLMMWTYLAAAFALTGWSTVFMWILS